MTEYAANVVGYFAYCGFDFGYIGHFDESPYFNVVKSGVKVRTVDIAKVHGSLDWFACSNNDVCSLPGLVTMPDGWRPLIVTPGVSKYEKTYEEPFRSVLFRADRFLENSNSYLSIGYGFNDSHIQTKLIQGVVSKKKRLVVLAKTLTDSTRRMLDSGLVSEYVAFEKFQNGTRIFCPEYPTGKEIFDLNLWQLDEFMSWATSY